MCSKTPELPAQEGGTLALESLFRETICALNPGPLVRDELLKNPLTRGPVTLLALGKAAVPMARAAKEVLGDRVVDECVVAPYMPPDLQVATPASWMASTHPKTSEACARAARALLASARVAQGEILALISGGGSALAALPAAGLTLAEKADLVDRVYAAGADIHELNIVRKHLSAFKGGRLAQAASVPITTLLVSDVVGDVLHSIASGPTLPDPSSFDDALQIVVSRLGPDASGPAAEHLRQGAMGEHADTPTQARPEDRQALLAGIGKLAWQAQRVATEAGMVAHLISSEVEGSIEAVARLVLQAATGPGLYIAGGEASIELPANPGQGGRAQQLALHLAREICGRIGIHILVAGSDGIDGNSQAAGALVDGETCTRLRALGIDPSQSLRRCDAGSALAAVDALVITGPTGVNHADLILVQIGC